MNNMMSNDQKQPVNSSADKTTASPTTNSQNNHHQKPKKSFVHFSQEGKKAVLGGRQTVGGGTRTPATRSGFGFKGPRSHDDKGGAKYADERNKRKVEKKTRSEYEERIVKINRISKTTKGGRNMRFSALVVIGNRKGKVGYGIAKALEVPNAIKKALRIAERDVCEVAINKHGTMYHEVIGRNGAARVLLKPAPAGTGLIAGGPIRAVIELAGFTDIYTKNLGKNTPVNMIQATLNGILRQLTPKTVAKLRDKELKDL